MFVSIAAQFTFSNNMLTQPSPSRSEASARKNVDVVRDWDLGVTSPLKVLQNA